LNAGVLHGTPPPIIVERVLHRARSKGTNTLDGRRAVIPDRRVEMEGGIPDKTPLGTRPMDDAFGHVHSPLAEEVGKRRHNPLTRGDGWNGVGTRFRRHRYRPFTKLAVFTVQILCALGRRGCGRVYGRGGDRVADRLQRSGGLRRDFVRYTPCIGNGRTRGTRLASIMSVPCGTIR
jgi:hypothetical protein